MSRARDLARLQPNTNGVLPVFNLNSTGYVAPKSYHATRPGGGISTSQTLVTLTINITSATNKVFVTGSDLLRCSSGIARGALQIDGVTVENEFMYLQGSANTWVTQTGIYTGNNLSIGSHTVSIYADFTSSAGAFDGPTYLQVVLWDGPSA
jgi:hypothetical protein